MCAPMMLIDVPPDLTRDQGYKGVGLARALYEWFNTCKLATDQMLLQVTVVFLVDASECVPSAADWPHVWEQQQAWKKALAQHEADAKAKEERLLNLL